MVRCAVEVCQNSSKNRSHDLNLRFHSFPKDEAVREKWIEACHLKKHCVEGNGPFICSDHFLSSDFERDLRAELLNLPPKRILKPDAIPSRCTTVEEIQEMEFALRKERFQQCLLKYDDDSNESFCDFMISVFGYPKIFISSSKKGTSQDEENSNSTQQTDMVVSVPNDNVESNGCATHLEHYSSFKLNLDKLCRLCGSFSDRVKSIMNNSDCDYNRLIKKYLPSVQVHENDSQPHLICNRCEDSLRSWNQFWKMCNLVNQRFQLIIDGLAIKNMKHSDLCSNFTTLENSSLLPKKKEVDENENNGSYDFSINENITISEAESKNSDFDSNTITVPSSEVYRGASELSETVPRKKKRRLNPLRSVCDICQKSFKYNYTRRIHMRTVHTEERPFLCNYCSARFKRRDHLQCHISMVHENGSPRRSGRRPKKYLPVKHLCAECGKTFCNKTSYREHVDSIHSNLKKYRCEECNLSFSRYSTMYHHKVILKHGRGKIQFLKACDFCGLEFESEIYYIRHLMKHEEVDQCEKCSLTFDNHEKFKIHVSEHHFCKTVATCDICCKSFSSKSSLAQHKFAHEKNEKPFECSYCNWRFRNRGHLVVHMYRHTGERPYVCNICNRGFKQKGDMRKHKAGHVLNEKKFYMFPKAAELANEEQSSIN